MNTEQLKALLNSCNVMVPHADEESMRIDFVADDENAVYCTGEESGEQYFIDLNDIDVNDYRFYRLQLVDVLEIEK